MVQKVVVVGQGYVGLPLAMAAAEAGFDVIGLEADHGKFEKLADGQSYVEDVSDEQLKKVLYNGYAPAFAGSVAAVFGLKNFDVAVITVPTPLKDGLPDLSYVSAAAETLGAFLKAGQEQTVILESTTYPGTTEEIVIPMLERRSGLKAGEDFHVGFSPERIDPGNKTWNLINTPKVVSGLTDACLNLVLDFYSMFVKKLVPVKDIKSAEMAKIIENTFRHVNIALVNELARLAHGLGVDIHESINAAASKPFGFMKFTPGPGVGGHCLPIDPLYLSHRVEQKLGVPSRFIDLAQDVNDHQPDYVVQRLTCGLNARTKPVKGSNILILGVAYKANSSDTRETPATRIVQLLDELEANLILVDPYAAGSEFEGHVVYSSSPRRLEEYDAVVIVTPHDQFNLDGIVSSAKYVLDTRNVVSGATNVEFI